MLAATSGAPRHVASTQPLPAMAYLKIQTNLPMTKKAKQTILRAASALIAEELGKPESFVMIALQPDTDMIFAGSDEPVAFLELKSVGLPGRQTRRLGSELCRLIHQHLGISPQRTYVKFIDAGRGMWGWTGDTFEDATPPEPEWTEPSPDEPVSAGVH